MMKIQPVDQKRIVILVERDEDAFDDAFPFLLFVRDPFALDAGRIFLKQGIDFIHQLFFRFRFRPHCIGRRVHDSAIEVGPDPFFFGEQPGDPVEKNILVGVDVEEHFIVIRVDLPDLFLHHPSRNPVHKEPDNNADHEEDRQSDRLDSFDFRLFPDKKRPRHPKENEDVSYDFYIPNGLKHVWFSLL
ncbi:MAG: hypothetical protein IKQ16_01145 [Lentisphaeria bacterium]|nr:hypothetical protein [Lentisphaeria bacterium]